MKTRKLHYLDNECHTVRTVLEVYLFGCRLFGITIND